MIGSRHDTIAPFDEMTSLVNAIKPDLILTQGFGAVHSSAQKTQQRSGDVGWMRWLGIKNGARVNSWEPTWSSVYYELAKTYQPEDIYRTVMAWALLRNRQHISEYPAFYDYFDACCKPLLAGGFLFTEAQLEAEHFMDLLERTAGKPLAVNDFEPLLRKMQHPALLADMHKIRYLGLLAAIDEHAPYYQRILVQADESLLSLPQ
ncbi:hypothetical protein MKQ68_16535 [Chitinophaga horti]|uniref:Uncharacterized protein n=1 Tax=Chitinophaga horti TaxID=2920382 RepID=A0ABY6J0L9_9BACT|nr:hypothetical protein [Chitinophaga horti]UYQ91697.1 hypothetical protein MKQ68_16535 [Chitinophaga horti]